MHSTDLSRWTHKHAFDAGNPAAERGTRLVMWVTAAMMVVEIAGGWALNSMALLADGLHMSSHAIAIGLSAFAYAAARRLADDTRFAFGTWKIEVLAGFASAVLLLAIAALMVFGSVERLIAPRPIHYVEAIAIAGLGLIVNVVCAWILGRAHHHPLHREQRKQDSHGHDAHSHDGHAQVDHAHAQVEHRLAQGDHGYAQVDHGHAHDLNLRSAYLHVIADAATSVLAIVALTGGLFLGWSWLDPAMGIAGAIVVAVWARGLLGQTSRVLLDSEMDDPVVKEIRDVVETPSAPDATRLADLHVWRVGKRSFAAALTVVTHDRALGPDDIRRRLAAHPEIVHVTVEVQHCE